MTTTATASSITYNAIFRHFRDEELEQQELASSYLDHLNAGGDPALSPVTGYARPRLDSRFVQIAFRAWEAERGDEARPFTPADGSTRYRVAAFMHAHLGEWIAYAELRKHTSGASMDSQGMYGGGYRLLRQTPYDVEKTTIDGRVHYRMVRRAEA